MTEQDGVEPRKKFPVEWPATLENLMLYLELPYEKAEIIWADIVAAKVDRGYAGGLHNAMKFLGADDCDRTGRVLEVCVGYGKNTLAVDLWTGEYFIMPGGPDGPPQ